MATILIVDDRPQDRGFLRSVLEAMGHAVVDAGDGVEALALARAERPALILSDILMPGLDGFALCRELQKDPELRKVPFVFVTATYGDQRYRQFAEDLGAVRVMLKPFTAGALRDTVVEVLDAGAPADSTQRMRKLDNNSFDRRHAEAIASKLQEKVAELEAANEALRQNEEIQERALDAMVATISKIVEYRDPYTIGHERRVGALGEAIGRELGLSDRQVEGIRIGGFLHDVGKMSVPSELLAKPSRLSDAEFELIKSHSSVGHDILSAVEFPWPVAAMALQHHERLDGSGYPDGLMGDQILLEARILAVADVVEAMSSHRPYRPAIGLEKALQEIERGSGTHYDPEVVAACLRLFREARFEFDTSVSPPRPDRTRS